MRCIDAHLIGMTNRIVTMEWLPNLAARLLSKFSCIEAFFLPTGLHLGPDDMPTCASANIFDLEMAQPQGKSLDDSLNGLKSDLLVRPGSVLQTISFIECLVSLTRSFRHLWSRVSEEY